MTISIASQGVTMKKIIVSALVIVAVLVAGFSLVSCVKEEEVKVDKIEAEVVKNTVYTVDTAFDTATIQLTAVMTDGTKTEMTNKAAVVFDKSGLKLINGKFSEAGTFTLTVTYLRHSTTVQITVVE